MKQFFKHGVLVLVLVALYVVADFYAKGKLLNTMLPVPVLGVLFWTALVLVVYDIVLKPAIEFAQLTHTKRNDEQALVQAAEAVMRTEGKKPEKSQLWWDIHNELQHISPDHAKLTSLVDSYYSGIGEAAVGIIKSYSWKAALCVVFSRNTVVDSFLLFLSQYKMAIALMKQYGYTSSPLFNVLCFFWIVSNSALNGIFSQANADNVGELIGDFLTTEGVEGGLMNKGLSKLGSFAVEALTAATTVYVTGWIINRKLKGDRSQIAVKELFKMRSEAKKALFGDLKDGVQEKIAAQSALV